jgi:hypothetical protein
MMAYHPNDRKVLPSWSAAARLARTYGSQTGWKYRVVRYRDWWMVKRTEKRCGPFKSWARDLGTVRMTISIGTSGAAGERSDTSTS